MAARRSPYQGLVPYDESDAPFFFGRERDTRLVIANLFASPLTLLYGPSGVGKSSLLHAGVVHALRCRGDVTAVTFREWQDDPLAGLKLAIAAASAVGKGEVPDPDASLLALADGCVTGLQRPLMVILDQFEERFLYARDTAFEDELAEAVNGLQVQASFLVSLRDDALARLDVFEDRIPRLFDNYLRVEHLDRESARAAICRPLDEYGAAYATAVTIEDPLVDAVLEQVQAGHVVLGQSGRGVVRDSASPDEVRIETPFLQLVLQRLWDEEVATGSTRLRRATLERLGGAERIVRSHLDRAMDALPADEQLLAARAFHQLVTPSRTKIAHLPSDLAALEHVPRDALEDVLGKLAAVRILRPIAAPPGQPRESRYEVFHDVLAPAILDWRARFEQVRAHRKQQQQLSEELAAQEQRSRAAEAEVLREPTRTSA